MDINLPKGGRYVIAVSGGVDSVCLLHILNKYKQYELVVAHFDHGIRSDSALDKALVEGLANQYKLPFYSEEGKLGPTASEAAARKARYEFLAQVRQNTGSVAIITAHHQDDRLETLFINLIRGTGRKGLSSIGESKDIKRPLLNVSKAELKTYANQHKLSWREDSTNQDQRYLRNYIRSNVLPKLNKRDRLKLLELMDRQREINKRIDRDMRKLYQNGGLGKLERKVLADLTYNESKELVASWLRDNNLVNFDHRTIERITLAAKTKKPGAKFDVYNRNQVVIGKEYLALDTIER